MTTFAAFVLLAWPVAVFLFFSFLPPRRAMVVATVAGWLTLPNEGFYFTGLPDYDKMSATSLGILLGTLVFDGERFLRLRPRWIDLVALVWCACPIASSLANDLGLYDGLSGCLRQLFMWGVPYLIGRLYLSDLAGLEEMAKGIVVGGLAYVPLCVFEMRMSPMLQKTLYGETGHFGEIVFGGYRPIGFFRHALELGMWMSTASLAAIWLWSTGVIRRLWGLPFGWLAASLVVTAVLGRFTGALLLLAMGLGVLYGQRRMRRAWLALALLAAPPAYMVVRWTGLWEGRELVSLARSVLSERRAESLETRLVNEDKLVAKALQRPALGWGGWGRNRVVDETGQDVSITDSMYVIFLGIHGLVGVGSMLALFELPALLFALRHPAPRWREPRVASAAVLAVLLGLYSVDTLGNTTVNPVYLVILGGLAGLSPSARPARRTGSASAMRAGWERGRRLAAAGQAEAAEAAFRRALAAPASDPGARRLRADLLDDLGRLLKQEGRPEEAEVAWSQAARVWAGLAPGDPDARRRHADRLNDLAWLLATTPRPAPDAAARAVRLARQAVELAPGCAGYWNTLGAACCRAGDWAGALAALGHSIDLTGGGDGFDHVLMALTYGRRGDFDRAREHLGWAEAWIARHRPDHPDLIRLRAEAVALVPAAGVPAVPPRVGG